MPPNQKINVTTLQNDDNHGHTFEHIEKPLNLQMPITTPTTTETTSEYKREILWFNVIAISLLHIIGIILLPIVYFRMKILTHVWIFVFVIFSGFGVTAGAHRLWSHRAYKAKLPLQIILLFGYAASGMNSLFDWVRDHRVHHKYSETDADPHNAKRGFFFSHVGWLMEKKHPEVIRKGKTLDFTDITEDPLLKFFNKYFLVFKILLCFILPTMVPVYLWNETWFYALVSQVIFRYIYQLNGTWAVNSFAHIWGHRPYDKRIGPTENIIVSVFALGEGWHNYHHVFPWDYKAAELGNYDFNLTTMFLDFFAKIGWAYDMKAPSAELVQKVIEKYGDGSHYYGTKEVPFNKELKKRR